MYQDHGGGPIGRSKLQSGFLMIELAISMVLLTVGVLSLIYVANGTSRAQRDVVRNDLVSALFVNAVETLKSAPFSSLYQSYHGKTIAPVTGAVVSSTGVKDLGTLRDSAGNPAQVTVDFFVNETALPSQFGPVLDINKDGLLATVNCATDYVLLPTRLRVTYARDTGVETKEMYLVLMDK
jgi:hypothetical protein